MLGLFLVVLLLSVADAHAQEPTVLPLRDSIEFGVISSSPGVCRLNRRGSLIGLSGQDCIGQGQTARYLIQGTANRIINIQAAGSSIGNLRFEPNIGRRTTRALNGNGRRRFTVWGDLVVGNNVHGAYALAYTVSINYE